MHTGKGQIVELILENGIHYVRVACSPRLIPSAGQFVLAGDDSHSPLPVSLFYTESAPSGFIAALFSASSWKPGTGLYLRGPLGRGFTVPVSARKVGLVAFDDSPARLRGMIQPALKQNMAVVLVCDSSPDDLPDDVEVQPVSALADILEWADYVAFDVARENLAEFRKSLGPLSQNSALRDAQILVRAPVPCGGVAECGVCAVALKSSWKLACKDGPVFEGREV